MKKRSRRRGRKKKPSRSEGLLISRQTNLMTTHGWTCFRRQLTEAVGRKALFWIEAKSNLKKNARRKARARLLVTQRRRKNQASSRQYSAEARRREIRTRRARSTP